jgi:hypothetical protein
MVVVLARGKRAFFPERRAAVAIPESTPILEITCLIDSLVH